MWLWPEHASDSGDEFVLSKRAPPGALTLKRPDITLIRQEKLPGYAKAKTTRGTRTCHHYRSVHHRCRDSGLRLAHISVSTHLLGMA